MFLASADSRFEGESTLTPQAGNARPLGGFALKNEAASKTIKKSMKLKGEMNHWKNRFFIGMVIAGVVLLCASCAIAEPTETLVESFESLSYQPVPTNVPEIAAIEGNAEIKLPSSAHEIHAYTTGMRDIFIMVRFSMNANELPEFMDSTLCDQPLANSLALQQTVEDRFDWWVPDQAEYAEVCSGEKEHSHQQIIIDMSDKDVYIVYVNTSTN